MRAAALRRPAVCDEGREPLKAALLVLDRHRPYRPGLVEQCATLA
jgi:hypothetical protein